MNTSQATSEAVKLLPDRNFICGEFYQSTTNKGVRTERNWRQISVLPAISKDCQTPGCEIFTAPSFPACLDQIRAAIQQNETSK